MKHDPPIYAFIKANINNNYWFVVEIFETINVKTKIHDFERRDIRCRILRKGDNIPNALDINKTGDEEWLFLFATWSAKPSNVIRVLTLFTKYVTFDYYDTIEDLCADHMRELL